jgi:uncharacterized protein (DUF1015 family)
MKFIVEGTMRSEIELDDEEISQERLIEIIKNAVENLQSLRMKLIVADTGEIVYVYEEEASEELRGGIQETINMIKEEA